MITSTNCRLPIELRHLTIYLLADGSNYVRVQKVVKRLNRYKLFTFGLFEFRVIPKLSGSGGRLIRDNSEAYNIVARIPDYSSSDMVCAFDAIDLDLDVEVFESKIFRFMVELSYRIVDIITHRIDIIRSELTDDNIQKIALLEDIRAKIILGQKRGVASYKRRATPRVICHSECARAVRPTSREAMGRELPSVMSNDEPLDVVMSYLGKMGVPEQERRSKAKEMAEIFAELFDVPRNTRDRVISGVVIKDDSLALTPVATSTDESMPNPRLTISVERVVTIKYRKSTLKYGIVVAIGDHSFPISFGSNDQTMLYITAIVRYKMRRPLYLHEWYNNDKGRKSVYTREKSYGWLKSLYGVVVGTERTTFGEWIDNVRDPHKRGRVINQAKSQSNAVISSQLSMVGATKERCLLNTVSDTNNDSYYTFDCSPDDIVLCSELQQLVDKFNDIYPEIQ